MKNNREIVDIRDFSGGLITNVPIVNLDTKYTPDCLNVYTEGNNLRRRMGFTPLNSVTVGAASKGNGFFHWVKSAAEQVLVSVFDNVVYKMDLSGSSWDGTWDTVSAHSASGNAISDSITHFVSYSGTLIFTTENRDPVQRQTVTENSYFNIESGGVGTAPRGKYCQVWKEHVWILNIAAGGVLNEEASSISNWTDNDVGGGSSTQTSFQGLSTFRFQASNTVLTDNAQRTRDVGTIPDDYTVEMKTNFDVLQTTAGGYAWADFYNGVVRLRTRWSDDGLEIFDGTDWNEVGVNTVAEDSWNVWKFTVTGGTSGSAVVDISKDGTFVGVGLDISNADATNDGQIDLVATGSTASGANWYMDYLYINSSAAQVDRWLDGDFSEWTDRNTPTQMTLPMLPTQPLYNFACDDDYVTNGVYNNGTVINASSVFQGTARIVTQNLTTAGKIGNAFNFTSANSNHIRVHATVVTSVADDVAGTIAMWVYPNISGQLMTIMAAGSGNGTNRALMSITTGNLLHMIVTSGGADRWEFLGSTSISSAQWTHVAITQNAGTARFFVNGLAETTTQVSANTTSAWMAVIGGLDSIYHGMTIGSANQYSGRIDDVRYYSTALTSNEILAIYAEGNGNSGVHDPLTNFGSGGITQSSYLRFRTSPALQYRLNDTAASTVVTNNGYTGSNGTASANASVLTVGSASAKISTAFSFTSASTHNVQIDGSVDDIRTNLFGSLCLWFFTNSTGSTRTMFSMGDENVANTYFKATQLNNTVQVTLSSAGALSWTLASPAASISSGSWYHMAVVHDGNAPRLYINGDYQVGTTLTTPTAINRWLGFVGSAFDVGRIGQRRDNATETENFDGHIDDVRYYERALTESDVRSIFNSSSGTEAPSPSLPGFRSFRTESQKSIDTISISNVATAVNMSTDETAFVGRVGNPTFHFNMNDNAATTVVIDTGVLGANGTASVNTNVITATGQITSALQFTGASSHEININGIVGSINTHIVGGFATWVFASATPSGFVIDFGDESASSSLFIAFDAGQVQFAVTTAGVTLYNLLTANIFSGGVNVWHHLAVSQDGNGIKMWLDGSNLQYTVSGGTTQSTWLNNVGAALDVGRIASRRDNGTSGDFFTGRIDDVRYYSRPLTDSLVRSIYNGGTGSESSTFLNKVLLKFRDLTTSVPSNATVQSATMYLNCVDAGTAASNNQISAFRVLQNWVASSVNWTSYDGTNGWATAGAEGTADINTTAIASSPAIMAAGSSRFVGMGFNTTGVAALQSWIAGSTTHNGFLLTALNTVSNQYSVLNLSKHTNNWNPTDSRPAFIELAYTIPEQSTVVNTRVGDDSYHVENRGSYSIVSQTIASGTALTGTESLFGAWVKADAGVKYKLRVRVNSTNTDSPEFTGNGAWGYRVHEFTPASGLTTADTVNGQFIMTTEGIMEISQPAFKNKPSAVSSDRSDRIQRSAITTYDDWSGTDSGNNDIVTSGDVGLTGSFILNDKMYVTKAYSIHGFTYTRSTPLVNIKEVKSGIGTKSPRSIRNVTYKGVDGVLFLGTNRNIYFYEGTDTQDIGQRIKVDNGLTSVYLNNINSQALDKVWAVVHEALGWYELFVPIGNSTVPDFSIVYDYINDSFWPMSNRNFRAGGIADNGTGLRDVYASTTTSGFTMVLSSTNSDNGTAINSYWASGKIGTPTLLQKIDEVLLTTGTVAATPTLEWRMDYESAYVTRTLSSATNEHNYNPNRIDNLVQFRIADNSVNPAFQVWRLTALEKVIAHGK